MERYVRGTQQSERRHLTKLKNSAPFYPLNVVVIPEQLTQNPEVLLRLQRAGHRWWIPLFIKMPQFLVGKQEQNNGD